MISSFWESSVQILYCRLAPFSLVMEGSSLEVWSREHVKSL